MLAARSLAPTTCDTDGAAPLAACGFSAGANIFGYDKGGI